MDDVNANVRFLHAELVCLAIFLTRYAGRASTVLSVCITKKNKESKNRQTEYKKQIIFVWKVNGVGIIST
jgi:hypothetical protein